MDVCILQLHQLIVPRVGSRSFNNPPKTTRHRAHANKKSKYLVQIVNAVDANASNMRQTAFPFFCLVSGLIMQHEGSQHGKTPVAASGSSILVLEGLYVIAELEFTNRVANKTASAVFSPVVPLTSQAAEMVLESTANSFSCGVLVISSAQVIDSKLEESDWRRLSLQKMPCRSLSAQPGSVPRLQVP